MSASPEEIVLPLAELLGADGAISSVAEVDDEGRYTGRMAFYAYGPDKAVAMRELADRTGIDLAASTAYSDSATDLPDARGGRPPGGGQRRPRAGQAWPASGAGRCGSSPSRCGCATG